MRRLRELLAELRCRVLGHRFRPWRRAVVPGFRHVTLHLCGRCGRVAVPADAPSGLRRELERHG